MAARNKSKKTIKSKTRKTRPASRAKTASKRTSKEASSSSVRSRARQEQAGVEGDSRAENNSSKDEEYRSETFEAKAEEPRRWNCISYARRGEEARKSCFRQEAGGPKELEQGREKRDRR